MICRSCAEHFNISRILILGDWNYRSLPESTVKKSLVSCSEKTVTKFHRQFMLGYGGAEEYQVSGEDIYEAYKGYCFEFGMTKQKNRHHVEANLELHCPFIRRNEDMFLFTEAHRTAFLREVGVVSCFSSVPRSCSIIQLFISVYTRTIRSVHDVKRPTDSSDQRFPAHVQQSIGAGFVLVAKGAADFSLLRARQPSRCSGTCGVVSQLLVGERREHEDQANGVLRHQSGSDCSRRKDVHGMGRPPLQLGGLQFRWSNSRRQILMM